MIEGHVDGDFGRSSEQVQYPMGSDAGPVQ